MDLEIPYVLDTIDEAPVPLRQFYRTADDGKLYLRHKGEPPGYVKADKHNEFRDNNRTLNALKTELETKLTAAEAARVAAVADAERLKADLAKFEGVDPTVVEKLTAAETQLAAEKAARAAEQFERLFDREALKLVRPEALEFVRSKAVGTFSLGPDGKVTTKAFSPTKPGEPLSIGEWLTGQQGELGFTFLPSKGGGAGGNGSGGGPTDTRKVVDRHDPEAFGKNLASIAAGTVIVR